MERHRELMRTLLNSRERRKRKRDISRLSLNEVLGELGYRGCALDGSKISLRERLLRAVFRDIEPENRDIPWYPWDDAVVVEIRDYRGRIRRATWPRRRQRSSGVIEKWVKIVRSLRRLGSPNSSGA